MNNSVPIPWYQRLRRERKLHGWSQADVMEKVGCDLKTIGRWERGVAFPIPYYRQKLCKIYEKSALELGLVEEDTFVNETNANAPDMHDAHPIQTTEPAWQQDWGEAPLIELFCGRASEIDEIDQWIIGALCRMVVILGIGGVGKTTCAAVVSKQLADSFDYVFWRSLQNAPPLETVLESYFRLVSGQKAVVLPKDPDKQTSLLIDSLRKHRCLLIFDNVESILQTGQRAGRYVEGYEGYGRLFQRIGETQHQSCLLLTSREKPREIVLMEGPSSSVRSFPLTGLAQADGQKLLADKALSGSIETWETLVKHYAGNPLALKLVSERIRELFGGNIADFLQEEETVFGDIHDLLQQQFHRLSPLEQDVIYWLAIEREVVSLNDLWENMLHTIPKGSLLEALDSLRRRSLIETSGVAHFTLQPVIIEYVTRRFVEEIDAAIETEDSRSRLLSSHALMKAQAKEYVRRSQVRLILTPIIERLLRIHGKDESEKKLKQRMDMLHTREAHRAGYTAGNLLNLLVQLAADLRGIDCSHLTVAQAYLQEVALPAVNFSYAKLATSVFADTFSGILHLAVSLDGELLAAGTTMGEIRLWRASDATPLFTCLGHMEGVRSVAFSPDGRLLASGGEDNTVRIWDTRTGQCLNTLYGHSQWVRSVAFSPDGQTIASGSEDQTIRLWNASTGQSLSVLHGHTKWIRCIAYSPTSNLLASGSDDLTLRLWDTDTGTCLHTLHGHTNQVRCLAFSPDGHLIATGSEDQTTRLWDTYTGECLQVLKGHTNRVRSVSFHSDTAIIATGSDDFTIRLWHVQTGRGFKVLSGHTNRLWSIVYLPDSRDSRGSRVLISASEDETIRFWDTRSGECTRTLHGYTNLVKAVALSSNGQMLASANEDSTVRLWDIRTGKSHKILRGHANRVRAVAFSPDSMLVASSSEDETVRLWNTRTGRCLKVLRGHTHLVRAVSFSPDGSIIASGSHDRTIRLWDTQTGQPLKVLHTPGDLIWSVAFSPGGRTIASGDNDHVVRLWDSESGECVNTLQGHTDRVWSVAYSSASAYSPEGTIIASASDDHTIRLWDAQSGDCLKVLKGHTMWVRCVAISPDGQTIASGSHDHTIRLWDAQSGDCLKVLRGHVNVVWSVAFGPDGQIIASGSDDGTNKLWDVQSGECLSTFSGEHPYDLMNITNALGLTDAQKVSLKLLGAIEVNEE